MYQIGVDIGGTNIKIGLVDDTWEIVSRISIPFPHLDGAQVAERIAGECHKLLALRGLNEDS